MRPATTLGSPMLAVAALLWLAPPAALPAAFQTDLLPGADPLDAVLDLCALGAWLTVGWLAVATAAAVAARLPGAAGRCAGALAGRITPAVVRRAVGGGAVVGLALAPALAPTAASAAGCLPGLDRGSVACAPAVTPGGRAATPTGAPAAAPLSTAAPPGDIRVTTAPATVPSATTSPVHGSRAGAPSPTGTPAAPAEAGTRAAQAATATVTVRTGDSLWSLAAAEIRAGGRPASPPAVAARWPAWWAANRAVVGPDPDLIYPGTVLSVPAPATTSTPEASR